MSSSAYTKLYIAVDLPVQPSNAVVLAGHDRTLRAIDRGIRLRVRVSIHVGPLPDEGTRGTITGCGRPVNDAHRLLDSTVVRTALASSDPDVSFVAALLSERVFEDIVLAGYTSMRPTEFTPHLVEVRVLPARLVVRAEAEHPCD